jgi:hypothetical protein
MTFEIYFENIPQIVKTNFLIDCDNYHQGGVNHINETINKELAKFKGKRFKNCHDKLVYEFESEAHYNWFVLRYS